MRPNVSLSSSISMVPFKDNKHSQRALAIECDTVEPMTQLLTVLGPEGGGGGGSLRSACGHS